jgi:ppGpp synthetase/RelA/SpoT-type nucleotidyltranferase
MDGQQTKPSETVAPADGADPVAPSVDLTTTVTGEPPVEDEFDFEAHRRTAVDQYELVREGFEECAQAVRSVLKTVLELANIEPLSIEARAKEIESFGKKAITPAESDPSTPKYPSPLEDITDLSGARVITFLLADVEKVNELIEHEFDVVEKSTKAGLLGEGQKLGYQSVHYLVKFSEARCNLPEYARFKGRITEIQVRTILQHGWAEIEHDIQYKAASTLPDSIRQRFMSLAGLVEIADREFQAISNENERVRKDARRLVTLGQLDDVEITPDALKAFLDSKYSEDKRMSDWRYGWTARILKRLGFQNFGEVNTAISQYGDGDRISRLLWGSRQGQLSRFENVLLAALGEEYITRHPIGGEGHATWQRRLLGRLEDAGIETGTYHLPNKAG